MSADFPLEQQSPGHSFSHFCALQWLLRVCLNNFLAVYYWKLAFSQLMSITFVAAVSMVGPSVCAVF